MILTFPALPSPQALSGSWRRDIINCQSCRCANSGSCLQVASEQLPISFLAKNSSQIPKQYMLFVHLLQGVNECIPPLHGWKKTRVGRSRGPRLIPKLGAVKNEWMIMKTLRKLHVQAKWIVERVLHKNHCPQKSVCFSWPTSFHHSLIHEQRNRHISPPFPPESGHLNTFHI